MEKETGYLYDIKKTIEDKNYIPIFNKLTLEDLEKFKDLGNTIYDIRNTSEVWKFFISNFSGYVPATLISNINNNSISISDIFPVTLEKYAKYKFEKELFSSPIFPFSELIFNNLKIKNWSELEFLYRKFEKYELILTSHQTMQRLPHGGKILQPTIYSMLIKLENKGQEILKILNS